MGKNSRGEKRAPSMCWRTASGEWLRTLSPKKVNARCGGGVGKITSGEAKHRWGNGRAGEEGAGRRRMN